mmetsp:Transcript_3580/g.9354  ORF Transcript_3580/g.9354 Transcript_3580/m.9354 type:complete len:462 (-) Transcript_3580:545-1930(-)
MVGTPDAARPTSACVQAEECARAKQTLTLLSSEIGASKSQIDMSAVNEQVWRVILFVVQNNRDILDYRHIDQIVLAAIYGVCKIHATDVTFKDLVSAYKKLPNASSDTWLKVPLAKPGQVGNIISFYNDVFVPRCKDYLHGMKDGSSITLAPLRGSEAAPGSVSGRAVAQQQQQQQGAGPLVPNATLTGSPNGFRAVKRPRVPSDSKGGAGGADAGAEQEEGGCGQQASSSRQGHGSGQMPPPLSPTRRPAVHLPRSPYAEYPASPFKRPAASPLRLASASPRCTVQASPLAARAAIDRSPQKVPSKYGQVTLSPARASVMSPLREAHTPRTAFLHSFGTLGGASPMPSFGGINEKLKSPGPTGLLSARSPAPRRMATKPLDFEKPRIGDGSSSDQPRTLSANSALLALAHASDFKRTSQPSSPMPDRASPAGVPATDAHRMQRMQDLAVASVLISGDDAQ